MMPSFDQTKPDPSACEVYVRSRPPKKPNGSKKGSTSRRLIVDSVWMLTTDGSTLCATTTTGVRRDALTVTGIAAACFGASMARDSAAGLQPREKAKMRIRVRFLVIASRFYEG